MTTMHLPHSLGTEGELLAARFLTDKGYRIIARNYRFRRNEIDIIARIGDVLCFVEVKTRASLDKGHPAEAVTPAKQKELIRAASGYLAMIGDPWADCRFDVIAILATGFEDERITGFEIEHFEGAFMA